MSLFWVFYSLAKEYNNAFLLNKIISVHKYYYEKEREKILTYKPNLIMPKTMNEKILWLLHHGDLSLKTKLTDKIQVKEWVSNLIGEQYVAKTYAICENLDDIDWSGIPEKFVIKASHGCRMNIFVKNKETFLAQVIEQAKKATSIWLDIDYSDFCGEIQYRDIPRKLLIEEITENGRIKTRLDFSFHCFNGEPVFIEHNFFSRKDAISFVYDIKGEQLDFVIGGKYEQKKFEPPTKFEEMIEVAKILSKNFRYVRIDLIDK